MVASDLTGPLEIQLQDREVRTLTGKTAEEVFTEVSNIQQHNTLFLGSLLFQTNMKLAQISSAQRHQNLSKTVEEIGENKCYNEAKDK